MRLRATKWAKSESTEWMNVAQEGTQGVLSIFELDFWNAENANYQNLVFSGYERSGQYTDHLQQISQVVRFF